MKFNASVLLAASLLASTATAAVPVDASVAAPISPRKAFPEPDWEELEKRGIIENIVNGIIDKIQSTVTCVGCEVCISETKVQWICRTFHEN